MASVAFDAGLFSGPAWLGFLAAIVIGGGSAGSMLLVERWALARFGRKGDERLASIEAGNWGCPRCGSAYVRDVTVCSDCQVPLVEAGAK